MEKNKVKQKLKNSKKAQMTAKVRQTNITRFLEAPLLRQAEGELKNGRKILA